LWLKIKAAATSGALLLNETEFLSDSGIERQAEAECLLPSRTFSLFQSSAMLAARVFFLAAVFNVRRTSVAVHARRFDSLAIFGASHCEREGTFVTDGANKENHATYSRQVCSSPPT
jgi:hypothetical protein